MHVSKLDRKTGYNDLEKEFSRFGKIETITLKTNYAFIKFESHEAATRAIEEMDNKPFVNGEILYVKQSSMYRLRGRS